MWLVRGYSFWTFSDIFEESGQSSIPFHGGFGLLNIHGIPKPSYRAFQLLARLAGDWLDITIDNPIPTVDCAASRDQAGMTIILSNHQVLLSPIWEEHLSLRVAGVRGIRSASLERIDETHCNPKKAWTEMESPICLDCGQIQALMEASELEQEPVDSTSKPPPMAVAHRLVSR